MKCICLPQQHHTLDNTKWGIKLFVYLCSLCHEKMTEKSWPSIEKSWFERQKVGLGEYSLRPPRALNLHKLSRNINKCIILLFINTYPISLHAYKPKKLSLTAKIVKFMKKCDFFIFSSKNVNVRSKNGACTLNS